ncbi:HET-domain-containing protein [Cubamyces sp. BRFM 1775]|nr:HET-domain-containing protein [Cubamyces sp. BRFM 1775]
MTVWELLHTLLLLLLTLVLGSILKSLSLQPDRSDTSSDGPNSALAHPTPGPSSPWSESRPDDVCSFCWEGVFAAGFGFRHIPVVKPLVFGVWKGGYQYFISHDELLACKSSNCMWYRVLQRDAFGAMLACFEDGADDRMRLLVRVGRPAMSEITGEPEPDVLAVMINDQSTFRISLGAGNPAAAWINNWGGILRVRTSDALALARAWVTGCTREHKACQEFYDWAKPEASLPTRLIDCSDPRRPRLVETKDWDPQTRYIALSYAWGGNQANHTTKKNISSYLKAIPVSRLPKTIVDAIQVTHMLGVRYLWVDSLCIIQDSYEDKKRELTKMRDVYLHAFLMIDAASAASASQGFLHASDRVPVDASLWLQFSWSRRHQGKPRELIELLNADPEADFVGRSRGPLQAFVELARGETGGRAWCLQETLMSGRRLRFAETLQFRCRYLPQPVVPVPKDVFLDMFYATTAIPDTVFQPTTEASPLPGSDSWFIIHAAWAEVVGDYTTRSLTYSEDTLVACAGIAEAFGRALGSQTEYLAGLWRDSLLYDLLWTTTGTTGLIRGCADVHAPSWSWAATRHPVSFQPYTLYRDANVTVPDWEELGEVVACSVVLKERELLFGRVTGGHLILRAPLLGPYNVEELHAHSRDGMYGHLHFDDELETRRDGEKPTGEPLWVVPLLYTPKPGESPLYPGKVWRVHCLIIQPQTGRSNVESASSTPEHRPYSDGVYRRIGGCEFDWIGADHREFLNLSQVDALRNKVDGRWTSPRTEIEMV